MKKNKWKKKSHMAQMAQLGSTELGAHGFPICRLYEKKSHMAQMAQLGSTELSAAHRVPLNLGPERA